ncbi:hypothetical protein BV923_13995 [Pectobacterium odoriferum]|nr:hypothetical protein BV923_13995 [Pectobacterium odoriferum]
MRIFLPMILMSLHQNSLLSTFFITEKEIVEHVSIKICLYKIFLNIHCKTEVGLGQSANGISLVKIGQQDYLFLKKIELCFF